MANIQLYTGEQDGYFSEAQIRELGKPLDKRLESRRRGGGGRTLTYIEGHDAIDQANRIFGYGNWAYEPVSLEQVVLLDPMTGEPVGIEYKALVKLTVRGAIGPIVDVGSQPVATWTVEDQITQRRLKAAQSSRGKIDESDFTPIERREARAVIVEAHEQAKKGAVTDALKRALRAYGNQFGNGLYGDGHTDLSEPAGRTVVESVQTQEQRNTPAPRALPVAQNRSASTQESENAPATEQQIESIRKLCQHLGKQEEPKYEELRYLEAKEIIAQLSAEYRQSRVGQTEQPARPVHREPASTGMATDEQKSDIRDLCKQLGRDSVPVNLEKMSFDNAANYITGLKAQIMDKRKKSA
jgi:DNA repair and recombination protein RAD52